MRSHCECFKFYARFALALLLGHAALGKDRVRKKFSEIQRFSESGALFPLLWSLYVNSDYKESPVSFLAFISLQLDAETASSVGSTNMDGTFDLT